MDAAVRADALDKDAEYLEDETLDLADDLEELAEEMELCADERLEDRLLSDEETLLRAEE